MKKPVLSVLAPLAFAVACAATAGGPQAAGRHAAYHPLRPLSSCLRTDRINAWHVVDARTAIVRTGPYRYLVKLQSACPRLGYPPAGLVFHPSRADQAIQPWTICGEAGETVSSSGQPPCAIQSLSLIGKAEFDRLRAQAIRHGSGADQPTKR